VFLKSPYNSYSQIVLPSLKTIGKTLLELVTSVRLALAGVLFSTHTDKIVIAQLVSFITLKM